MPAIVVENLVKQYGKNIAVNNISFNVEYGEIFGFLGPNGAGKTTTLEILEGLRCQDSGIVKIDGKNPQKNLKEIKEIIGVQLQSNSIYEKIKVKEVLKLFASYYKKPLTVQSVLDLLHLNEKRDDYYKNLSGGQKQRLTLGLALIHNPKIIFLDEPSTGIDPHARRNLWSIIKNLKKEGKTIVLSSHYMDEAQELCDRVAIINKGEVIELDSPDRLIKKNNLTTSIHISLGNGNILQELNSLPDVNDIHVLQDSITLFTKNPIKTLTSIMKLVEKKHLQLKQVTIKEPNLEDLFLELTGRELKE